MTELKDLIAQKDKGCLKLWRCLPVLTQEEYNELADDFIIPLHVDREAAELWVKIANSAGGHRRIVERNGQLGII